MQKRLVIFDLDGTLLDTITDLATATNYALQVLGYPTHTTEKIRTFVGNGINKLIERALPPDKQTEENIKLMRTHFIPFYNEHNAELSKPYPGIKELLLWLSNKGIQLAVASNKYQEATEKLITHYFADTNFIKIFGQRADIPIKPNPTTIFEIMKYAGVTNKEVLYVGDSDVDMQTAINAGIDAVGVTWGFRTKPELESFHPMAIIDNAEGLKNCIYISG